MSATCVVERLVTGLFAETTATTSSAWSGTAKAQAAKVSAGRRSMRFFMATPLEDEVHDGAEHVHAAAEGEIGLDIAECTVGTGTEADPVPLHLDRGGAHEVPTRAERNGGLVRQRGELPVEHGVGLGRERRDR